MARRCSTKLRSLRTTIGSMARGRSVSIKRSTSEMTFVASQNLTGDLIRSAGGDSNTSQTQTGVSNLPLRLAGSMPTIRAQPDMQYVARQVSSSLLQTGLSKGLDALVGKKRAPNPAPEGDAKPIADATPSNLPHSPALPSNLPRNPTRPISLLRSPTPPSS